MIKAKINITKGLPVLFLDDFTNLLYDFLLELLSSDLLESDFLFIVIVALPVLSL